MSEILKIMQERHSVRQYEDKPIPEDVRQQLNDYTKSINGEYRLNIQIIYDEPECYSTSRFHYGKIEGCKNYIALVGPKDLNNLEETCGYAGELIVLKAQELGLNTCWTATTHGKSKAEVSKDEKEVILIALGYGATRGHERNSKTPEEISNITQESPDWFKKGIEAALLAPTAINQQKFTLTLKDDSKVKAEHGKLGPCLKTDLGIVKCHFELGAGKENFTWAM